MTEFSEIPIGTVFQERDTIHWVKVSADQGVRLFWLDGKLAAGKHTWEFHLAEEVSLEVSHSTMLGWLLLA